MHIYYSVVLIKRQPGRQTYNSCKQHDPISAKDLLWPQRPCFDGADTSVSCELEWWQAGLWPSAAQSWWNSGRSVLLSWRPRPRVSQTDPRFPGFLLSEVSSSVTCFLAEGGSYTTFFSCAENLLGFRAVFGEGRPGTPVLNNPRTAPPLSPVLRGLSNFSSPDQGAVPSSLHI